PLFQPGGAAPPRRPTLRRRGGPAGGPSPPALTGVLFLRALALAGARVAAVAGGLAALAGGARGGVAGPVAVLQRARHPPIERRGAAAGGQVALQRLQRVGAADRVLTANLLDAGDHAAERRRIAPRDLLDDGERALPGVTTTRQLGQDIDRARQDRVIGTGPG